MPHIFSNLIKCRNAPVRFGRFQHILERLDRNRPFPPAKLVMGGSKKKQSAKDSSSSNDAFGCGAAKAMVTLFASVVALNALAVSEPSRWRIADGNRRIEWNVAEDRRLPHGDSIEMSGRYASLIFSYNVSENGELSLKRQLVWPMYRKAPNNTHGSFTYTFGEGKTPQLLMNGRPCGESPKMIALDGVWRGESVSTSQTLRIVRHVFPSVHHSESIDTVDVTNSGDRECTVGFTKDFVDYALGCTGRYEVRAQAFPAGERTLKPGETASWTLRFSVRYVNEEDWECDGKDELDQRSKRIEELTAPCVLETGIPEHPCGGEHIHDARRADALSWRRVVLRGDMVQRPGGVCRALVRVHRRPILP